MTAQRRSLKLVGILGAGLLLLAVVLLPAGHAAAATYTYTYTFDAITDNNSANVAAGEAQLRLDLTGEPGSNTVTFTFYLAGNTPMAVTGIYFYDGVLGLDGSSFQSFVPNPEWDQKGKTGVSFTLDANPPKLPGSDLPRASVVFSADAGQPAPQKGINPGESLGVIFVLPEGYDVLEVVAALNGWLSDNTFNSGDLVVGLHVQAINHGGSESFVVKNLVAVSPVPVPSSLLLLGSGLGALWLLSRSRRRPHR